MTWKEIFLEMKKSTPWLTLVDTKSESLPSVRFARTARQIFEI
jgi:hypothetical protein